MASRLTPIATHVIDPSDPERLADHLVFLQKLCLELVRQGRISLEAVKVPGGYRVQAMASESHPL